MQNEFIPFDSDEDLPHKRKRLSKDEQIYGVFYDQPQKPSVSCVKTKKCLNENELEKTYGKGFALLQKSGYKVGSGLGKNNQGRTDIIGVQIRKKNEGLSFSKIENLKEEVEPAIKIPKKDSKKLKFFDRNKVIETSDSSDQENDPNFQVLSKIRTVEDSLLSYSYEEKQLIQGIKELETKESEVQKMLKLVSNCKQDFLSIINLFAELKTQKFSVFHELFIYENFVVPIIKSFFVEI